MRNRRNAAASGRALSNIDNLLPENLMLKTATIDDDGNNVTIVAMDFMRHGELFAITINPTSSKIVAQEARRGTAGSTGSTGTAPGA